MGFRNVSVEDVKKGLYNLTTRKDSVLLDSNVRKKNSKIIQEILKGISLDEDDVNNSQLHQTLLEERFYSVVDNIVSLYKRGPDTRGKKRLVEKQMEKRMKTLLKKNEIKVFFFVYMLIVLFNLVPSFIIPFSICFFFLSLAIYSLLSGCLTI
jgi:DNA topoisomerase VI subunit B